MRAQSYSRSSYKKNRCIVPSIRHDSLTKFFVDHFKTLNLLRQGTVVQEVPDFLFKTNREFWRSVIYENVRALHWVTLENFQISGWYPRSPGLYHEENAEFLRKEAESHVDERDGERIYTPTGKGNMIDGGIGSVRFKAINIEGEDCWLCTATSDQHCHSGVPLAIPNFLYREIDINSGDSFRITGEIRYLPDFLHEQYFHHWLKIPQLYVLVEKIEWLDFGKKPILITPMVFFKKASAERWRDNRASVTFARCYSSTFIEVNVAASWMQEYVERHDGEIITNFDQQRPIFKDAPFSLQKLMSREIDISQLRSLNINEANVIIDSVHNVYSERTQMTKINVQLGDGTTIHGDFVVANSIRDSFNKVAASEVSDNLRDLLKELAVTVGKMTEQLPEQSAQQVARDLETLTAEATSKSPRRPWWELSAKGLKEAASSVGEIGKPVLEVVARLLPFLSEISG